MLTADTDDAISKSTLCRSAPETKSCQNILRSLEKNESEHQEQKYINTNH